MYTKLYAAIVDSTLMEEPVMVRYVFMTMLAIADQDGYVASTPKAAASRLAISLEEFESAIESLSAPDPNSNFPDHDGRRIIPSDRGRGWLIVTFRHYSEMRNEHGKREYMRDYMREYRAKAKAVKQEVKTVKVNDPNTLTTLAHIEGEGEGDKPEIKKNTNKPPNPQGEVLPHGDDFAKSWTRWKKHRTEIKKPLKPTMMESQLKRLGSMSEPDAIAMIEHTIEKGWQGMVDPKASTSSIQPKPKPSPTASSYKL